MLRITLLSVFISMLLVSVQSVQAEKLRMGYFMLPPHTFNDGQIGPAQGAGVTYFNEVARKMGYEVEWVGPLPLPRLTEFLRTGKVDGTVGFPKFPLFEKFLFYADTSVYMAKPSLGIKSDAGISEITSIDNIKGFRIGFVKSKSGKTTPLIDNNRKSIHLREFHGNHWMEQNLKMVHMNRLEALYDRQEYTMRFVAIKLGLMNKIKVLPMPAKARPMYIAFSKKSPLDGKKLLDQCNSRGAQIVIDYGELLEKEFQALAESMKN